MNPDQKPTTELTPELAKQILLKDLSNILDKVKAKKPLSKHERKLFEEYASQAPEPEAQTSKTYQKLEKDYAKQFKCSARTIRNWKAEGAPLDDPAAMEQWKASRKNLPPGLKSDQTPAPQPGQGANPLDMDVLQEASDKIGAPQALTRLEKEEVAAHAAMLRAMEEGNPLKIKNASDLWLKISDNLLRYDRQVEANRRDSGELMSREQVEKILKAVAFYLRILSQQEAVRVAPKLVGIKEPATANKLLVKMKWEQLLTGFSALASQSTGEMAVPKWATAALVTDLNFGMKDAPEVMARRAAAIEELAAYTEAETIEKVRAAHESPG